MDKKVAVFVLGITLFLIAGGMYLVTRTQAPVYTGLDDFAKCLTAQKAVMYGAAWCPHCQAVKKTFGDSFKYVTYVECPEETQKCLDNKVNGYPTWIFGNEKRLEGEQSLEKIAEYASCSLPKK